MTERIPTRISTAELERRWSALRQAMRAHGLEAVVAQNANDWLGGTVKWLTDIPAQNGYPRSVVFHLDEPMTVIEMGAFAARRDWHGSDETHRGIAASLGVPAFLSVDYTQDYEALLVLKTLSDHGYRRVGLIGAGAMPHRFVERLETGLAGRCALVDATGITDRLKAIKSDEEVGLIRQAADLQDAVFAEVLESIRPGLRDIDVTAAAQHLGQCLGSEQGIFLAGSAPLGQRASFLGRHMQGRTLQKGDHLSLLIEINGPGGFYTEIARTIVLGRASQELREGFEAARAAQAHTLTLLRPGASCAGVAASHDDFMRAHNLPAELRLYAHGQGYDMVERPLIRHDETMEIAAGMCLAVHPGFETDRMFSVICDNYMVTKAGVSECLHRTEKKIFEIV